MGLGNATIAEPCATASMEAVSAFQATPHCLRVSSGTHARLIARILPSTTWGAFARGFALSLVVGLCIVLLVAPLVGIPLRFGEDPRHGAHDGYWEIAANLARGHGYVFNPGGPPVTHRPPLVPLLLAPLTLLPPALWAPAVVLLQSLLVGVACALLMDLASRIADRAVARLSVGALLCYPWLFWHLKNPMNVVTQMTCVLLVLDLLARELLGPRSAEEQAGDCPDFRAAGDCPNFRAAKMGLSPSSVQTSRVQTSRVPLLAAWQAVPQRRAPHCFWRSSGTPPHGLRSLTLGLSVAAAVLTHGTMLLSLPALLGLAMVVRIARRQFRGAAVVLLAMLIAAAAVAPWTWRNWRVTGRFIPVASNAGFAYFLGNAHWGFEGEKGTVPFSLRENRDSPPSRADLPFVQFWGLMDLDLDAALTAKMRADIAAHPGQFAHKIALNALEYYWPISYDLLGADHPWQRRSLGARLNVVALSAWHAAIWALALVGLWRRRQAPSHTARLAILGCILVLALPYLPFLVYVGHAQYTLATIPLLCLLAAAAPRARAETAPPA